MNQSTITEEELYKIIHREVSCFFDGSTSYSEEVATAICKRLAQRLVTPVEASSADSKAGVPVIPTVLSNQPIAASQVVELAVGGAFKSPRNLSKYGQACYELGCQTQAALTGMRVDTNWKITRLPDGSISIEHSLCGKWVIGSSNNTVAHMFFDELLAQNTTYEATRQGGRDMIKVVTTAEHLSSLQSMQQAANEMKAIQEKIWKAADLLGEHLIASLTNQK